MTFALREMTPVLGAEITGLDLSKTVSADTAAALNAALARHAVLVFRDQSMDPAQFTAAGEVFGPLMPQQLKQFVLKDHPLVGYNSTHDLPRKNGKLQVRGENYHTDHSNYPAPPKGTTLHAVALPSYGGDTQFVDARQAFDDLPEAMQQRIVGLRSLHVHQSSRSPRSFAKLSEEEMARIPRTLQPLVIRHPDSGRAALYLNTGRMEGVEGLDDEAGYALIEALYAHATQPRYEYRHRWQVGDLVIWDNRSVLHQANADYDPEEYRYLLRIMLQGAPLQAYSGNA
jgi:taurine dioxygenase